MVKIYPAIVEVRTPEGRVLSRGSVEVRGIYSLKNYFELHGLEILRKLENQPSKKVPHLPVMNMAVNEKGRKALIAGGILDIRDIVKETEQSLTRIRGVGYKTIEDIKAALSKFGLSLEIGV